MKTNVDTDKFKIYSIDFFEREALSDDLFLVSVKMVNRDDRAFSQTYYLNGLEPTDLDDVSFDAPKYETTAASTPERSTRKRSPLRSPGPRRCCPRGTPSSRSATTR